MKKLYCVICSKYRKFASNRKICKYRKKPKISYLIEKTWPPSTVCSKCKYENKKIFKEEESNEMLKILDLVNSIEECQKIWNHAWRKHESII